MLNKYNNEIVREMYQGIIKIVNCYHNGFTMTDFNNYIDVINSKSNYDDLFRSVLLDTSNQIFEIFNQFKEIIANFAEIDTQQNNSIDEDPIVSVYSAVEALVKAYDLKKLAAKVNALPASDTQQNDSFEQFQPGIHAFMDAYDIDTAAAFNTKTATGLGTRPTVNSDETKVTCETFIPDFSGNLYGTDPVVEFYAYLSPSKKFYLF